MKINYHKTISNITVELTPTQLSGLIQILRNGVSAQLIAELELELLIDTESELYGLLPTVNVFRDPLTNNIRRCLN